MPYATSGKPYDHGPSVKNPATYEALITEQGMSKARAAAISNAALKKGHKKGVHRKKRSHGRKAKR